MKQMPLFPSTTLRTRRAWLLVLGLSLGGFAWGWVQYGVLNGIGVLSGAAAMVVSLFLLKFTINKIFQGKDTPRSATTAVVFAWVLKLPATLGLLTIAVWLCGRNIGPMATVIVLVYFAIVIGVFGIEHADHPQKK